MSQVCRSSQLDDIISSGGADDRGWPSRSRLPPGLQLPKSPPHRLSPPSLARSSQGEPRKRKISRGNGAGRAQASRRAREKLQHKRPMTGRAPATGPGSSPSSERSGPAQPAARRGARRALLPGQECAARRAHTHPGARPKRTGRQGTQGQARSRTSGRLLPGGFESQQLVTC